LSNKNSYENTDVAYKGGLEYGSDIHGVSIRTNQIIWDMIKVLDRNMLFGFHFKAKISTHKTIIIMTHKEQEMLDKAKKLLRDFNNSGIIILAKIKEEKRNRRLLKIATLIIALSALLYALFEGGLYLYNNSSFYFNSKGEQKILDANNTTTVKLDIRKLKAMQESFDKEDNALKPEIMSALDVTTEIISDFVPPSEKEKYSSKNLVDNFNGKGGLKFELDDSNMSQADFNKSTKELNDYAMRFIKDKNVTGALKCYDKVLKDKSLSREDRADTLSKKASLDKEIGDLNKSKEEYLEALGITKDLAKKNPLKYGTVEAFNIAQLSEVEQDLNNSTIAKSLLKKANIGYIGGLDRVKRLYKRNPKKYREDLAWNYNILANFYLDDWEDLNKSITYRKKAIKLYKKLYKKDRKLFTISLFKTYNSLAKTYIKMENIKLAKINYKHGFDLVSKGRYKRYKALSHHNLGFVYAKNREYKEADKEYNRALKIYKSLDKNITSEVIQIHYEQASIDSSRRDFKLALEKYRRVIDEYKKLKRDHSHKIAETQNSMIWIYLSQPKFKNHSKAKELIDSSIKLVNIKDSSKEYQEVLAKSYSYLAHLLALENRLDSSLLYYQKSINLKRDFETDRRYTTILIAKKDYLKAFRNLDLMLNIYKKREREAKILMDYGKLYLTIDKSSAEEKLKKSLKIYKKLSKSNKKEYQEIKSINRLLDIINI
jgi:tetratricopeptide (TPR) repeat protein